MSDTNDEIQISKLEFIFLVGLVGSLLFATWEIGHLMVDEWFKSWVDQNRFTNERIIRYGIAFVIAIPSIIITSMFSTRFGRFGASINRAFLWFGTILLLSTIAIFIFDCLPEVCAGFIGAGIFILATYILQKKFFTKSRLAKIRLDKNRCPWCEAILPLNAYFCTKCGHEVGSKCPNCQGFNRVFDKHCSNCGIQLKNSSY
jgi:hypothetical protein